MIVTAVKDRKSMFCRETHQSRQPGMTAGANSKPALTVAMMGTSGNFGGFLD